MPSNLAPMAHSTSSGGTSDWSTPTTVDHQFIEMLEVFRASGGLAALPELSGWCKAHRGPTGEELQGWIGRRTVLCLHWQSQLWLPWFQFNRTNGTPRVQMRTVLAELNTVHAPWEACRWFTLPNPWLDNRMPVDALLSDLSGVLRAAQADRVIANGDGQGPRMV